ncbi:exosome complex exonuclease Rrp41 [Candidatus Woesearchaeota archaeon CG10_big_fil_rev_8_21_14_0_10_34_12]|nr:MAG: exosome complex exonuclease Rrp41 [Candidatus Woesearchaeota archaeon CG10_big_fil_rev_8_21_14_0_10_34_12]
MGYTKRYDGRKFDESRETDSKAGIIPRALGSGFFQFGNTKAIAAVYGPKTMHPKHKENPEKGVLRCTYDMMSFSVTERKKPGPSRRSQEISKVSEWALQPVIDISEFPNTVVDVHIMITQADASTRCAGINAASIALAQAGIPMKELVTAVSIGKIDDKLVVDVDKEEEDHEGGEGATDIAMAFTKSGDITLLQLDGNIQPSELKEAIKLGRKACDEIYEKQKEALIKTE